MLEIQLSQHNKIRVGLMLEKKQTPKTKKNGKAEKIIKALKKIDIAKITRRINEDFRERIDKKNRERQEVRDSLGKEIETGSACPVCHDEIVEYRTERIRQRTGFEPIGGCGSAMGELPPISYKSKYYCRSCRIKYEPPLQKSNRT